MLHKFGTAEVLTAALGSIPGMARQSSLNKNAHRYAFQYEPRDGYLYVRSRAISSRCNLNYDDFPADEIRKSWRSFIGKPVFVNHDNDDVVKARGVIIDAALHDDLTPDGADDAWVEVLMEVDATSFPKLAQSILSGDIERTSMGVDCEWSQCSVCDNVAFTEFDFCDHIPDMKGMTYQRADGEVVLVREIVGGLTFFENSLLVEDPADPTAHFIAVDDRGVGVGSYRGGLTRAAGRRRWAATTTAPDPFAQAAETISAAGGTTVSTHGQAVPTSGYMVALPDRERVIPASNLNDDSLRDYANTYRDDLMGDNRFLGGWVNEGDVYLDVSEHMTDRGDALVEGLRRNQKAVWDLDNSNEIGGLDEFALAASVKQSVHRFYIEIDPDDYDVAELVAFIRSIAPGATMKSGMRRRAFGERTAPAQIETLDRRNVCPVCNEASASFDGEKCLVCGYIEPPEIFQDPNLEEAGNLDALRDVVEDEALMEAGDEGLPFGEEAEGDLDEGLEGEDEFLPEDPEMDSEMAEPGMEGDAEGGDFAETDVPVTNGEAIVEGEDEALFEEKALPENDESGDKSEKPQAEKPKDDDGDEDEALFE